MRAVFRYPGSKWSLARWIIAHFPEGYERLVYVEPFLGSGAVFFNKKPGVVETINDLDGDIVNLFRVLRDQPEELRRLLALTPYSREEYDKSFLPCEEATERARRYMVRTTQAIGTKLGSKCGWRNHKQVKIGGTACKWAGICDTLNEATARLRGSTTHLVQIEQMDALQLIERYDNKDALLYLDPPYVRSSRKSGALYRHELDDIGQRKLLDLALRSRAKIVLSGYPSQLYDEALGGWHRSTTTARTTSTERATECLWTNYAPPCQQMDFWSGEEETT